MENIQNTMENDIKKIVISSFEEDISQLDKTYVKTAFLRDKLTEKLMDAVDKTNLFPNGDPDTTHAQLAVFNSVSSILNDIDKQIYNRANLKLKVKQGDSEEEDRKQIIEILNNYSLKELDKDYVEQDISEIEKELDDELEKRALEINDGELLEDPKDHILNQADTEEE
jgi:hypothetical protein